MANATLSGVGIKININIPYSLLSSRTKLNSLVERGNREQGTGNRKISCVINSVPLLSNLLDNKSLLVVKNYY